MIVRAAISQEPSHTTTSSTRTLATTHVLRPRRRGVGLVAASSVRVAASDATSVVAWLMVFSSVAGRAAVAAVDGGVVWGVRMAVSGGSGGAACAGDLDLFAQGVPHAL